MMCIEFGGGVQQLFAAIMREKAHALVSVESTSTPLIYGPGCQYVV